MSANVIRTSVIAGAVIGAVLIGGFPSLFFLANNPDLAAINLTIKLLLLGSISGLLMGLANGFLMNAIVFNRAQPRLSSNLFLCILANALVDSIISLIPLYYSAYIMIADANNGVVNGMALVLAMLLFSLPPTAITIFLMAVVVPLIIFIRNKD